MSTINSQDKAFIDQVRSKSTGLLFIDDSAQSLYEQWNTCFGGAAHLQENSFIQDNDGLTKTDIENALNVLASLHTWLNEGGYNRIVNLQKLRMMSINTGLI
jgi:hypothetical protein